MQLVFCQKCRNPIARVAPGSKVEVKCKTCGAFTLVELKQLQTLERKRILADNLAL